MVGEAMRPRKLTLTGEMLADQLCKGRIQKAAVRWFFDEARIINKKRIKATTADLPAKQCA